MRETGKNEVFEALDRVSKKIDEHENKRWLEAKKKLQKEHGAALQFIRWFKQRYRRVVVYICSAHVSEGEQESDFQNLLKGHGCALCAGNAVSEDEFLLRCRKRFGGKFDYSDLEFRGMEQKCVIKCPTHGPIPITPERHLRLDVSFP
jgi:hypothetical protein